MIYHSEHMFYALQRPSSAISQIFQRKCFVDLTGRRECLTDSACLIVYEDRSRGEQERRYRLRAVKIFTLEKWNETTDQFARLIRCKEDAQRCTESQSKLSRS